MVVPKEDSKGKILATASRLFQLQGYHATGINQIIKESGLPKGSIYHHFPNGKEELAIEAVKLTGDIVAAKIKEILDHYLDPVKALQVHIQTLALEFNEPEKFGGFPVGLLASETSLSSESIRMACLSAFKQWEGLYETKLLEGGFDEDTARKFALIINAMIEGGIILSLTHKSGQPLVEIAEKIAYLLQK